MEIVGKQWELELVKWSEPMSYEAWAAIVEAGMVGDPATLKQYYDAEWEPHDCHKFMVITKKLKRKKIVKPPKPRVVTLDVGAINKRFALCLYRECFKLTTRRMTPEAKALLADMQKRMTAQLGLDS